MTNAVVLITGALTGIGRATALAFAREGASIVVSGRHDEVRRSGSIINVSSTFGHTGGAGASVYVASKHAVEGLTKSAALEAAKYGVRVNVVAPGPIDTEMLSRFTGTDERKAGLVAGVPLKRVGEPEEIAQTIVFLASSKASFIDGASIAVDGRKTAQ